MGPRHLVATVLAEPSVVEDLELRVMTDDLWLWPVRTAPVVVDGPRMEFQVRRRMVEQRQGVSRRASAGADDERQHTLLDLDALLPAQLFDIRQHGPRRHEPERVVVRA